MPRVTSSNSQVTVMEDTSWERMWAGETYKLIGHVRPWLALGLALLAGYISHRLWGRMPAVPWAVAGLTLAGTGLSACAWATSRLVAVGRAHTTATVAALLTWLMIATITGPLESVTGGLLGIFGSSLAFSWNLRHSARSRITAHGSDGDAAGRLTAWFRDAAAEAGIPAKMQIRQIGAAKADTQVTLPPGKTAADFIQKLPGIESAMQVPPGALTASTDDDRADQAGLTISDPRVLARPVPWPGPSLPGASIAAPLRPGIWQDGEPVAYIIVGHHVFMMGASGAGKSIGGAWNLVGEIITRPDACVLAADVSKGDQTFGPLRPALHRFETEPKGARQLLDDLYGIRRARMDYLAAKGLQKWREGCGLSYIVAWLEEAPTIYELLSSKGEERFEIIAKEFRSAGGTLVLSLQRNTWDQLPTIIRSQMASMCFGLNEASDERYGLSENQQNAGASPSQWGIKQPGMAYLDAPSIPDSRIAMPLRTFAWGEDDTAIRQHAALYPAASRPVDEITARICNSGGPVPSLAPAAAGARASVTLTHPADDNPDDELEDDDLTAHDDDPAEVLGEYLTDDDPTPEIEAGIDDEVAPQPGDAPFEFDLGEKISPEDARTIFYDQLAAWRAEGREEFGPKDFKDMMRPGMGRAWIQARLAEESEPGGQVERLADQGKYRLRTLALNGSNTQDPPA
jgi:hypothetical protein